MKDEDGHNDRAAANRSDRSVGAERGTPQPVAPPKPRLWITRPDAIVTVALVAALMVVIGVIVVRNASVGRDVSVVKGPELKYLVDMNSAPETELALLPGIGPVRARKIVEWRAQNGRLKDLDDVKKASRMPTKELERLKDKVTFGGGGGMQNAERRTQSEE